MAETTYQGLTPAELLAVMQIALGGGGPQGANRDKLLQLSIVQGAKRVWYHSAWRWRILPYQLTTTASQAYTTLPANYRTHRILRHLWLSTQPETVCRYVDPAMWDITLRQSQNTNGTTATGRPQYCTVKLRTVSASDVFVVEWTPTPDDAYAFNGLEYLKSLPSIDFTASTNLFPEDEFDVLWQAAAFRSALTHGITVGNYTDGQRMMGIREFDELMEQAEDRWALSDSQSIDTAIPDLDGVLGDTADTYRTLGDYHH